MKSLYSEIFALDNYLTESKGFNEVDMDTNTVKFQVDGNTILHMLSTEVDDLKVVLDYLGSNKKEFLTAILMKNNKGKTPLDLSIENDSPKCTDLLLSTLAKVDQGNYSQLFYGIFGELLRMKLISFHTFLDS